MYKKILIGGMTAAAIVGAGGTALAVSGSDSTNGTPTGANSGSSSTHAKKGGHSLLKHLEHGQFVTRTKKGTVTHDLIRGSVTAVSATSVTVQAADKTTETFVLGKATKVRVRQAGKGTASTVSALAKGDTVLVTGTGTSTKTAKHVVDIKGAK